MILWGMSVVNISVLDQLSSMWPIETTDTLCEGCQIGPVRACSPSGSHFGSTAATRRGITLKNDVIDTLSCPPVCKLSLSFCLSLSGRSLSGRQSGISSVFVSWDIFEVFNFLWVFFWQQPGERLFLGWLLCDGLISGFFWRLVDRSDQNRLHVQ